MASAAVIEDEEEFHLAEEEAPPNPNDGALSPPPPREEFSTPLPPDVMEELAAITNKLVKFKENKNPELEDMLQLFIQEWRGQTQQEIDDLKKLKEHVARRKAQRAEEAARFAEMMREEEEMQRKMAEEEKIRKQEEKLKRLQEAEMKRQKMMEEQAKGRNFKIAVTKQEKQEQEPTRELTKEEYEAMRTAALSVIIKPLEIGGLGKERLKRRCREMWDKIVKLETERYDLEEKRTRQEYDFKELKERQKQQLRQKALKLGLDPEALTGRYPPKIRVASKYERRKGLKPFGETKGLFEGGFIEEYNQKVDDAWHKRQEIFTKRNPDELPPWLADMPRQILKQIEEEEAAIKAVIMKEELEGKQQEKPEGEEGEAVAEADGEGEAAEAKENEEAGEEGEEKAEVEEEGEEEAEEEEEGMQNKEVVIEDKAPEEEDAASTAATEEVEEEEEEEEEAEEEGSEAAPEKPSPAKQQEEELEEEEEEEEEEVDVVPKEATPSQEEEEVEEEEEEEEEDEV